jgi:hypothetical protein
VGITTGIGVFVGVGGGKVLVGAGVSVGAGVVAMGVSVVVLVGNGVNVAGTSTTAGGRSSSSGAAVRSTWAVEAKVGETSSGLESISCNKTTNTTANNKIMMPPNTATTMVRVLFIQKHP